jgi:hypothetical protein
VLSAGAPDAPRPADGGAEERVRLSITETDGFHSVILFWEIAAGR